MTNALKAKPFPLKGEYTTWSAKLLAGIIACADAASAAWFKDAVDSIELDTGVSFRAWPAPEPQVGKATFNAKGLNITPEQAVTLIKAYNRELGGGVAVSRAAPIIAKISGDPIIEIVLSDNAAAILGTREPRWKLNFGTDQRRVTFHGKIDLAKRLQEEHHELADRFRTTSLINVGEDEEENMLVETAEDRAQVRLFGDSSPDISSPTT